MFRTHARVAEPLRGKSRPVCHHRSAQRRTSGGTLHRGRNDRVRCIGLDGGNLDQGIATLKPRIDELRAALAEVLPEATRFRRVGLITYGPGPGDQCNVRLDLKPTANAASLIMRDLEGMSPAGKTPFTTAVAKLPTSWTIAKAGDDHRFDRRRGDLRRFALRAGQGPPRRGRPVDRPYHRLSHEGIFLDRRELHPGCQMSGRGKPTDYTSVLRTETISLRR